jgi:hypothetical protein
VAAEFLCSELMSTYNLEKVILVALTAMELNYDEFISGGLHENYAVATWIWQKTEENQENLCQEGRS